MVDLPSGSIKRLWPYFYVIICLILLVYYAIKSFRVPFFVDETVLLDYLNLSVNDVFLYNGSACLANNHILSTLWFKFINQWFWLNEPAIRFTSLLSFILFAVVIWKIAESFLSSTCNKVMLSGVLLFNFQLSEYFYLARGYAISNSLVLLNLFILLSGDTYKKFSIKAYNLSLFIGSIAVISNFSYFYISFVIFGYYSLLFLKDFFKLTLWTRFRYGLSAIVFVLFVFYYVLPIGKKIVLCDPYIPSGKNFITGTLYSLAEVSLPEIVSNPVLYGIIIGFWVFWASINFFRVATKSRIKLSFNYINRPTALLCILFGWFLLVMFNYYSHGVGFPLQRALSSIVIIIPLLGILWIEEYKWKDNFQWLPMLFYMLSVLSIAKYLIFLSENRLTYTFWKKDYNAKQIVKELALINKPLRLDATVTIWWPMKFYIAQQKIKNIECHELTYNSYPDSIKEAEYVLIDDGHYHLLPGTTKFETLTIYKPSGARLMRRQIDKKQPITF